MIHHHHRGQAMIQSTIKPIEQQTFANRTTKREKQSRSVMFCSSTKDTNVTSRRSSELRKHRASSAVPIPHAMLRSPSEVQLLADERVADERDFVFYARLMSGIRERTMMTNNDIEETERCLTHIMQTRHQHGEQLIEDDGVPILSNNDSIENGGYYLEDLDSLASSSSSLFDDDSIYQEETECMLFDLEL